MDGFQQVSLPCWKPARHPLGTHEIATEPQEDTRQPHPVCRHVEFDATECKEAAHLLLELLIETVTGIGYRLELGTGHRTAVERSVYPRITKPPHLTVFDVVKRQRLAGDLDKATRKLCRDPQNGRLPTVPGIERQIEGPGVVEIEPVGQGLVPRKRIGIYL